VKRTLHQTALLVGLFMMAAFVAPSSAYADRVRWTVQAVSAYGAGSIAWDLEARVATMTYGEMRLKAFAAGELAKPEDTFRAVSIGAVAAAVLPLGLLPFEVVVPPDVADDPIDFFQWLAGEGLDRIRSLAGPKDIHIMTCGFKPGVDLTPSFLLVHLPKYRLLEQAQVAVLEAACDAITLDRLGGIGRRSD
jgi:hypothetical protein